MSSSSLGVSARTSIPLPATPARGHPASRSRDAAASADPRTDAARALLSNSVSISPESQRANGLRTLERELLGAFENRLSPEQLEIFERAGRSEYLQSIADPSDRSAEGTAARILGGITGYIFGAFQLTRGELTAADLDEFESEALRGFELGLGQARELLEGLGALSGELDIDIGRTAELVRGGIRDFVDEQRARLPS